MSSNPSHTSSDIIPRPIFEKESLLIASVRCSTGLAAATCKGSHNHNHAGYSDDDSLAKVDGKKEEEEEEVHMVMTGSPRPTFAETNAWLLDQQRHQTTNGGGRGGGVVVRREVQWDMRGVRPSLTMTT